MNEFHGTTIVSVRRGPAVSMGGDVSSFVPREVEKRLKAKFKK